MGEHNLEGVRFFAPHEADIPAPPPEPVTPAPKARRAKTTRRK
jgi:hypothetical protein